MSVALRIETQHSRIPWRWVILIAILSQAHVFVLAASASMTFSLRRFIESPTIINSITSLDVLFNVLVAAPCLYLSDRIWTRFGRRLPFVLAAWAILAACLLLLPLASHAVPIAVLVVLWLIFWDVGSTFLMLQMEIIPPPQRGRAMTIGAWFGNIGNMFQIVVISGRFDDVVQIGGMTFRGEHIIYWFGALCAVFCIVFALLFIRERPPSEPPPPDNGKRGIPAVLHNLFGQRVLWPVYLLAFSVVLTETGMGSIGQLLVTEQWGYSKQDMGTNVLAGGLINMLIVIPLIGLFADRLKRITMFSIGVGGMLLLQIAYYVFVQYVLPDQRPAIAHMIFFGQMMSICGTISSIALTPLLFEFIPRNQMGTAQAGLNFVRSITRLITLNGVALWVSAHAFFFMPEGRYDYFSGQQFMIVMNVLGCAILVYFALQVRSGKLRRVADPITDTQALT